MSACHDDLRNDDLLENELQEEQEVSEITLKKKFAKALAKVLNESVEVRELIKKEALKKINYDYDVLYYLINDIELSSGNTLEDLMMKYLSKGTLSKIKEILPTITIFVPQLPENSFSANVWNTKKDVPCVAVRTGGFDPIPIFYSDGRETLIEKDIIPGYPIVVIKKNEKIVASIPTKADLYNAIKPINNSETQLMFLASAFNNINGEHQEYIYDELRSSPADYIPSETQKIYQAWLKYKNVDGWQRDYVYYDIEPEHTRGRFNNGYQEYLSSFKMLGTNPTAAFNKISKNTDIDPKPYTDQRYTGGGRTHHGYKPEYWTEGQFEFMVKISIGTKHPTGNEIVQYFAADPKELFDVKTVKIGGGGSYRLDGTMAKAHTLELGRKVPLFPWNLEYFSPIIKIGISEIDNPTSTTTVVSQSIEYAANFELNTSSGDKEKVGLKFGTSAKETRNHSFQVVTTFGNDDLGEAFVNFGDPVVANCIKIDEDRPSSRHGSRYELQYNKVYTFWYEVDLVPKYRY
jgi:hypothetical protein